MIRATNATLIAIEDGNAVYIANLYGASTDAKPTTGYANGSTFLEVDTGKIFLFNESDSSWTELS